MKPRRLKTDLVSVAMFSLRWSLTSYTMEAEVDICKEKDKGVLAL
jgi:hypothetical protein